MYLPLQKVAVGMLFFLQETTILNGYFHGKVLGKIKYTRGNKKWHLMIVDIMHILTQNKNLHKSFVVNHRSSVHKKNLKNLF